MPVRRSARVYRGTPLNLARLARALQRGELVAVPTETVYGLAANALDAAACRRIFRAKRRPATDPLIVHIHERRQFEEIAVPNSAALRLAAAFWPGPLTLIVPKRECIPAAVSAGLSSVAVRMPRHSLFRRLLKLSGLPLAAPSANPFGYVSPTSAQHVRDGLGARIDYILDGGSSAIGLESTIVDLRDEADPRLLRPGAVTADQLASVLGRPVSAGPRIARRHNAAQVSPGLLKRHYSPRTKTVLHDQLSAKDLRSGRSDEAYVFVRQPVSRPGPNIFWLDPRGDLRGAARRLFAILRQVDAGGFARIHLELARGDGLASAINDRLRRAAAQD